MLPGIGRMMRDDQVTAFGNRLIQYLFGAIKADDGTCHFLVCRSDQKATIVVFLLEMEWGNRLQEVKNFSCTGFHASLVLRR